MPDLAPLLGRTLVFVAHPDDETIGCGALLQRMREPAVVFCTDGAPRDEYFWSKYGSRSQYASIRQGEARRALAIIGVMEIEFLSESQSSKEQVIIDQELHCSLDFAWDRLTELIARHRPNAIVTTAYEGGHPDHDACSLLAAVAGQRHSLAVWEFPLYHRISSGEIVYQRFIVPEQKQEVVLVVTPKELENKEEMIKTYASQHPFLFEFDPKVERVRRQHAYDYSRPPHPGRLNYEAWQWPITGAQVCASFRKFTQSHLG